MTNRTCDGCSKCCEGWLRGEANQHTFYPGKPCHYLAKGCSIYDNRPKDPCQQYKCMWLESDELPMWMRPDLCNAIVTKHNKDGVEFYSLVEAGQQLDSAVLSWFLLWALNNNKNLMYEVKGGANRIGSSAFLAVKMEL